jgi:hypothetical protein
MILRDVASAISEITGSPSTSLAFRISPDAPITYSGTGNIVSRFVDDIWDFTLVNGVKGTRRFDFNIVVSGLQAAVRQEAKEDLKTLLYLIYWDANQGLLKMSTLVQKLIICKELLYYFYKRKLTLFAGLTSVPHIMSFSLRRGKEMKAIKLHAILGDLYELGEQKTGLRIPFHKVSSQLVKIYAARVPGRQHTPLPTRIYSEYIARLDEALSEAEKISDDFGAYLRHGLKSGFDGAPISDSLRAYLSKSVQGHASRAGAQSSLRHITGVVTLCVLTFSGMRMEEAASLPFDCLDEESIGSRQYFLIKGVTKKFSKGEKRATWVTSSIGARAIRLAQRIFGCFHSIAGDNRHVKSRSGKHLLMCRFGALCSMPKDYKGYAPDLLISSIFDSTNEVFQRFNFKISKDDLTELKMIEPGRAWESEPEYAVGASWPFMKHQLRRSLALYAHSSGLVSLPTLKRQLQHITAAMSRYYARGSMFAKSVLVTDKKHFANEWNETTHYAEFLAYQNIIFSDEKLFGGGAAWARSDAVKRSPVSIHNREQTILAFKRGQMAFEETVLGGCTNPEPCQLEPMQWLPLECLENNCKHLVGSYERLARVLRTQERLVEKLGEFNKSSVAYRLERQILNRLKKAVKRYE